MGKDSEEKNQQQESFTNIIIKLPDTLNKQLEVWMALKEVSSKNDAIILCVEEHIKPQKIEAKTIGDVK